MTCSGFLQKGYRGERGGYRALGLESWMVFRA